MVLTIGENNTECLGYPLSLTLGEWHTFKAKHPGDLPLSTAGLPTSHTGLFPLSVVFQLQSIL